jgi:hypothetical protein
MAEPKGGGRSARQGGWTDNCTVCRAPADRPCSGEGPLAEVTITPDNPLTDPNLRLHRAVAVAYRAHRLPATKISDRRGRHRAADRFSTFVRQDNSRPAWSHAQGVELSDGPNLPSRAWRSRAANCLDAHKPNTLSACSRGISFRSPGNCLPGEGMSCAFMVRMLLAAHPPAQCFSSRVGENGT